MPANDLWRGSVLRATRFHDEKGNFGIKSVSDITDCAFAGATALLRRMVGFRVAIPWIALPAYRYVKNHLTTSAKVFEWGAGMSTLWYERHAGEVYAVEDNEEWYEYISRRTRRATVAFSQDSGYVNRIREFPLGYFDLIVIDGSYRHECLQIAPAYLQHRGLILVDNTDKDRTTRGDLWQADAILTSHHTRIQRFTGWAAGNFFPQETTIFRPWLGHE